MELFAFADPSSPLLSRRLTEPQNDPSCRQTLSELIRNAWRAPNPRVGRTIQRISVKKSGAVDTIFVYTIIVKNVTLTADEHLIEQARSLAKAQHKTLNTL